MSHTTNKNSGKFRIPIYRRLKRRLMSIPPLIVWGGALIAATSLYLRQEQMGIILGYAAEVSYTVASEVPGRLKRLEVSLHQEVVQGQIVGALDEGALLLDLQECRAELEHLRAELVREDAIVRTETIEFKSDSCAQLRRFARDVENAHLDYLESIADLAEDKIRLQGLELNLNRSRALNGSELTPQSSLDEDRVASEALKVRISKEEPLLLALEQRWHEAENRYDRFVQECVDQPIPESTLLKPYEYALKVQEIRIEQVNLAMTRLMLQAPANGRVSEIYKRPGESTLQGEAVVVIIEPCSHEVVAYVPEENIQDVKAGCPVTLRKKSDPESALSGKVTFIGEEIEQLPRRLNPAATIPQWGLALTVALPENVMVKPGEAFQVMFKSLNYEQN